MLVRFLLGVLNPNLAKRVIAPRVYFAFRSQRKDVMLTCLDAYELILTVSRDRPWYITGLPCTGLAVSKSAELRGSFGQNSAVSFKDNTESACYLNINNLAAQLICLLVINELVTVGRAVTYTIDPHTPLD